MLQSIMEYISQNGSNFSGQIRDHLIISLLALFIAALFGIPLGYLASKSDRADKWITGPFQILRVIPSLAILVLLLPVLGVGIRPAAAALTILAIPPVLVNTCVGFRQVPAFLVECGEGIGMTDRETFFHVRVPQALPMILSGIRTSLVEVIASATLAAKIGAGGLGEIIFTGLGLNRADLLVLGGASVAILSLLSGLIFDLLARRLLRYKYV